MDSRSTKFVQMISLAIGWPLTFLRQGKICVPMHTYGENVKKTLSQNVLKTNGWNLQWVIKIVKHLSYNQHSVPWGLPAYASGLYSNIKLSIFKCLFLWNRLSNFHQISHGTFCQKGIANWFKWFRAIEQDGAIKSSSPELRKLWDWILIYSIMDSRSTNFVQMMTVNWHLIFLQQC